MNDQMMLDVIKQDEETKDLQLKGLDILKVYQYLMYKYDNTDDAYTPKLIKEPYIEFILVPTLKKQLKLKHEHIKKYMDIFESEIYLQEASFDAFHAHNEERMKALDMAKNFVIHYDPKKEQKGLYIFGKYGSGKSYLLSCIAQELLLKGVSVLLTYVPDIVRSMKTGIQQYDLEKRVNMLKQMDVLMLDDIGGEFSSAWFRDEILMPVLQYRMSANLPTFFSSNYSLRELTEVLKDSNATEENRVKAARLVRRILDMTTQVKLVETYTKP